MLSDESSSDSETGRFKGRTTNQDAQRRSSNQKEESSSRFPGRNKPSENDRFRRDFERQRDDRSRFSRPDRDRERDRHRYSRQSPIRRRHSRERSPGKPHERYRHERDSRDKPKLSVHRSTSRDRQKRSSSRSHRPLERSRDIKEEIKRNLAPKDEKRERHSDRDKDRKSKDREKVIVQKEKTVSPDPKPKRSEVHRPSPTRKRKSESPIVIEHSDESDEVKPGSYYNMIPAIVKEKSEEESSEIDSSDDEKLRAKLLNLEKELHKTRKKKHKKKSKKKSSKSSNHDREEEPASTVEVTSTTDIQDNVKNDEPKNNSEVAEVSSTQKSSQKESCEEGEISSDDDNSSVDIDPTDLRHKLKRSKRDLSADKVDVCGPALPPHLQKRFTGSSSSDIEGPALPPHLKSSSRNIGPSIPEDMRKVLADRRHDDVQYESSEEDVGIGPLPTGAEEKWSDAHKRLEERALDIKIRKLEGHSLKGDKVKSREQWMLELPEGKAKYLGLEARSFRAKEGPDMSDRSSWTDTPEEKARKAAGIAKEEDADVVLQREAKARQISSRDEQQEQAIRKHKKKHKREESLLEMHQKKLKKKKKKEEKEDGHKERRPFSRDVDLQVNRFDEAQKKSIIKKAQDLNSRFGRGEAKFL